MEIRDRARDAVSVPSGDAEGAGSVAREHEAGYGRLWVDVGRDVSTNERVYRSVLEAIEVGDLGGESDRGERVDPASRQPREGWGSGLDCEIDETRSRGRVCSSLNCKPTRGWYARTLR